MKLGSDISGNQIVGARESQQDSFRLLLEDELGSDQEVLVVLADGMGGHRGGAEASRIVVDTFAQSYRHAGREGGLRERLKQALHAANANVREAVAQNEKLRGMGSTLAAVVVRPERVIWTSVGDSPIWLWRRGRLRRLNADHSMRGELDGLVAAGRLTAKEAARHPQRNALRSAVCGEPLQLIDVGVTELSEGDIVLLGSDGVQTLSDGDVARILDRHESDSAAALVERCLAEIGRSGAPHQDNATLVICKYGAASLGARLSRAMPLGVVYGAIAGLIVIGAGIGGYAWFSSPPPAEAPAQQSADVGAETIDPPDPTATARTEEGGDWHQVQPGEADPVTSTELPPAATATTSDEPPATGPDEVPATAPDEVPATALDEPPATGPDEVPATAPDEVPATVPDQVPATRPAEAPAAGQKAASPTLRVPVPKPLDAASGAAGPAPAAETAPPASPEVAQAPPATGDQAPGTGPAPAGTEPGAAGEGAQLAAGDQQQQAVAAPDVPAPAQSPSAAAQAIDPGRIRNFIGPDQLPNREVTPYALVALTRKPEATTRERYLDICTAFLSTLVAAPGQAPAEAPDHGMITYWPIGDRNVTAMTGARCDHLVDGYDFYTGLAEVRDADRSGDHLVSRRGPILVAWAPPASDDPPDALTPVVLDLSDVEEQEDFRDAFTCWRSKVIESGGLQRDGSAPVDKGVAASCDIVRRHGADAAKVSKPG